MTALVSVVHAQAGRFAYTGQMLAKVDEEDLYDADGKEHPILRAHRVEGRELRQAAKMALDAGVAEREVRIAEALGGALAGIFQRALAAGGVEGESMRLAVEAFASEVAVLEAGE